MNVFKKLQDARVKLHNTSLNKSGKNNFAKFNYFELADFIPTVTKIFNDIGLCGIVSFSSTDAYLTVYNADGDKDDFITFTSPLVMASMDRVQPIQSLGATHTYMRRYLWLMAMEIVENDAVDAAEPASPSLKPPFKPAKVETKPEPVVEPPKAKVHVDLNGKPGDWQIKVEDVNNLPAVVAALDVVLALAKNQAEVKLMFQANKNIFEALKANNPNEYAEVLDKLKKASDTLPKE